MHYMQIRDKEGIREDFSSKLIGLKRTELSEVLSGARKPPPLGALLFRCGVHCKSCSSQQSAHHV